MGEGTTITAAQPICFVLLSNRFEVEGGSSVRWTAQTTGSIAGGAPTLAGPATRA